MKKQVGTYLKALVLIGLLCVTAVSVGKVHADNESLWVNTGTVTKTLVAGNISYPGEYFDKFCTRTSEQEKKYIYSGSQWLASGYSPVNQNCWTQTTFGMVGEGGNGEYIRFGQTGAVTKLNFGFGILVPLPQSDKIARKLSIGSSFYYGLGIYDNLSISLSLRQNSGLRDQYVPNNNVSSWRLTDPSNGQNVSVNAVGVSDNGKWMVIEGANSFFRLNVDTKEMLAFEIPLFGYGGGQNPTYELAISGDGRYAIIGGGTSGNQKFLLYDLSTCLPVSGHPLTPSTGCGKRDLKAALYPAAPANQAPHNFTFSPTGDSIAANFYENNQNNHYVFTAPGQDQHLLEYLALGDSFSSGEGDTNGGRYYLAGTDGNGEVINNTGTNDFPYWKEKCHNSIRSYPYLLAQAAGLSTPQFRSIACSSADLNDVLNTRSDGTDTERYNGNFDQMDALIPQELRDIKSEAMAEFVPGRAAQIEFLQKYKPRVATIGIGGNDVNFGGKVGECAGFGTCSYASHDKKDTGVEIYSLYGRLVKAYKKLKEASPTTRFYVVNYPILLSDEDDCWVNVRFNQMERDYAKQTEVYLNRTIQAAAAAAGVNFLNIDNSLSGHNLCSGDSSPAVNGLTGGNDKDLLGRDTQWFAVWGNESYHPNNIGHTLMTDMLRQDLNNQNVNTFDPCLPANNLHCNLTSSAQPTIPAYFEPTSSGVPIARGGFQVTSAINPGLSSTDANIQRGSSVSLASQTSESFKPGSTVTYELHSTPITLGQATVNSNGQVASTVTIPAGTEPGFHTIHMKATTPGGDAVDYYQSVFVYATEQDIDGDGIANEDDTCGLIDAANVDEDSDGIDDACDGFIGEVEQHPLYRVRNGDPVKNEVATQFYIERDVLEAKSKLNIVNDYDPDGDGWAVVGHTDSAYDNLTQSDFSIDTQNVPHLKLQNEPTCTILTPTSLAVVAETGDRGMTVESDCTPPTPATQTSTTPPSQKGVISNVLIAIDRRLSSMFGTHYAQTIRSLLAPLFSRLSHL